MHREPATVGGAAQNEGGEQQDGAEEKEPEAECIGSRERYIARTDVKRDEVVHECRANRHHHHEQHRQPVHGEQLVVGVGAEDGPVGRCQLQPDQKCFEAGDEEGHQSGDPVHETDPLVVDRRDPAPNPGWLRWGQILAGVEHHLVPPFQKCDEVADGFV